MMDEIKMSHQIMCTFYLYEVAHDVCYQGLIENNFFVSVILNMGKVAYTRFSQTSP